MKVRNILTDTIAPLEIHTDGRGEIIDIFYSANIHHVAVINNVGGSMRGNHYHKNTTQYLLVTQGECEYVYQPLDESEKVHSIIVKKNSLITTSPNEVHAFILKEDSQFIVFIEGIRGGPDYEKDTIRKQIIALPDGFKLS